MTAHIDPHVFSDDALSQDVAAIFANNGTVPARRRHRVPIAGMLLPFAIVAALGAALRPADQEPAGTPPRRTPALVAPPSPAPPAMRLAASTPPLSRPEPRQRPASSVRAADRAAARISPVQSGRNVAEPAWHPVRVAEAAPAAPPAARPTEIAALTASSPAPAVQSATVGAKPADLPDPVARPIAGRGTARLAATDAIRSLRRQ